MCCDIHWRDTTVVVVILSGFEAVFAGYLRVCKQMYINCAQICFVCVWNVHPY
jgi:hypothetical protein